MKTKRIFSIGLVFCFLFFSTGYTIQATKATHIIVSPSGDSTGITDANAIEKALCTISQRGTVKLTKGQFYVSRLIEVEGFAGTLKGAGKDKTIIEVVENSEPDSYLFYDPYYAAHITSAFLFLNPVAVQISELTVDVNEAYLADEYFNPWAGWYGDWVTAINSIFYIMTTSDQAGEFDTVVTQIRIEGGPGDFYTPGVFFEGNIAFALYINNIAASEGSVHVVENCDFEYIGGCAIEHWDIPGATLIVESNAFRNLGIAPYQTYGGDFVEFSDNTIIDSGFFGIFAWNFKSGLICDNLFTDVGTSSFWGVNSIALFDSRDFIISNNAFVNARGIRLSMGCSHNIIVGNDYRQSGLPGWEKSDTFPSEYGSIWLLGNEPYGPPTSENLVIEWRFPEGTTLAEQILDEGVDNLILAIPRLR